jgi:hypothetical protein
MSGAILPLPQYALMAWCSVEAQGQLYLYLTSVTDKCFSFNIILSGGLNIPQICIPSIIIHIAKSRSTQIYNCFHSVQHSDVRLVLHQFYTHLSRKVFL